MVLIARTPKSPMTTPIVAGYLSSGCEVALHQLATSLHRFTPETVPWIVSPFLSWRVTRAAEAAADVLLVARHGRVDGAGPGVYTAGEGLGVVEALLAEPHGDVEGAGTVVAEDDDGGVGVELVVGAAGDLAHGHEQGVGEVRRFVLPGLADVEDDGRVGLLAKGDEFLGRDLRGKHKDRIAVTASMAVHGSASARWMAL